MPRTITVKPDYDDSGNCRQYFKAIAIDDKPVEKPFLICVQEECTDCFVWYTTSNDGTWNEPESPIHAVFQIKKEDNTVLREAE